MSDSEQRLSESSSSRSPSVVLDVKERRLKNGSIATANQQEYHHNWRHERMQQKGSFQARASDMPCDTTGYELNESPEAGILNWHLCSGKWRLQWLLEDIQDLMLELGTTANEKNLALETGNEADEEAGSQDADAIFEVADENADTESSDEDTVDSGSHVTAENADGLANADGDDADMPVEGAATESTAIAPNATTEDVAANERPAATIPSKEADDKLYQKTGFRYSLARQHGFAYPWSAKNVLGRPLVFRCPSGVKVHGITAAQAVQKAIIEEDAKRRVRITNLAELLKRRIDGQKEDYHLESLPESVDARLVGCACCGFREFSGVSHPYVGFELVSLSKLKLLEFSRQEREDRIQELETVVWVPCDEDGVRKRPVRPWLVKSVYPRFLDAENSNFYHVHPELVFPPTADHGATAFICTDCADSLLRKEVIPERSIKSGVDFGSCERLGLPSLAIRELHMISYVRHYMNIVKVQSNSRRLREHQQSALKGSSIIFDQDSPQVVGNLLSPESMNSNLCIHFVGHKGEFDALYKKTMDSKTADVFGRSWVIYQWLTVLKVINPLYRYLRLKPFDQFKTTLQAANESLLNDPLATFDDDLMQAADQAKDDVAGVRATTNVHHQANDAPEPVGTPDKFTLKHCFVTHDDRTEFNCSADSAHSYFVNAAKTIGVDVDADRKEYMEAKSYRSQFPVNEFVQGDFGLIAAFPSIFMLGKGYPKETCDLSEVDCRHLLLQFTGAPSSCSFLIFYLFDVKRRHQNIKGMAGRIRNDTRAFNDFIQTFTSTDFQVKLQSAVANPDGKDAKYVLRKLLPVLTTAGKHTSFGTLERNSAQGEMLAMIRRFGPQFTFLTIAVDDVNQPHVFRLTFRQPNNTDFPSTASEEFLSAFKNGTPFAIGDVVIPTTWSTLAAAVTGNPVASAFIYQRLMHSIATILIGLKPATTSGSNNRCVMTRRFTANSLDENQGIMVGNCEAFNGVHETSGRGAMHCHLTIWSAVSSALLQGAADMQDVCDTISETLDSMFCATLPRGFHVKDLIEKELPFYANDSSTFQTTTRRGRSMMMPPDPVKYPDEFKDYTETTIAHVGIHTHDKFTTGRCHKPPKGLTGCSLTKPSGLVDRTKPVELKDDNDDKREPAKRAKDSGKKKKITIRYSVRHKIRSLKTALKSLPPNLYMKPLRNMDPRLIVWEIRRPTIAPLPTQDPAGASKEWLLSNLMDATVENDDDDARTDLLLRATEKRPRTPGVENDDMPPPPKRPRPATTPEFSAEQPNQHEIVADPEPHHAPASPSVHRWRWPSSERLPRDSTDCFNPRGDGNCLFYSMLFGSAHDTYNPADPHPSLADCQRLRREINEYLLANPDKELSTFVPISIAAWAQDRLTQMEPSNDIAHPLPLLRYTELMASASPYNCNYGSLLEAYAYSHIRRVNVVIYQRNPRDPLSCKQLGSNYVGQEARTVCLLYDPAGQHYQTLLPRPPKPPEDDGATAKTTNLETGPHSPRPASPSLDSSMRDISSSAKPSPSLDSGLCDASSSFVSDAEIRKLRRNLMGMTVEDLQELYNTVASRLEERNGYVVDYNPTLTAVLGCHTNSLLLGSSEQSKGAANYLGPYVNKNKTSLAESLDIVWEAVEHVDQYPSVAEDSTTDKRKVQYTMTRILNKLNMLKEYSDTQAAAALLGLNVSMCSEIFTALDVQGYINFVKNELKALETPDTMDVDDGCDVADDIEDADLTSSDDNDDCSMATSNDDEEDAEPIAPLPADLNLTATATPALATDLTYFSSAYGSCPLYKVDDGDRLIALPYPMLYRYRGKGLKDLNRIEYFSCVRTVQDKPNDNDLIPPEVQYRKGRSSSTHFRFGPGIEISASHHQILRTKQCTPKIFRSSPPHPGPRPKEKASAEEKERWQKKADAFAMYYLVLFRPEPEACDNKGSADHYSYAWKDFVEFVEGDLQAFKGTDRYLAINRFRLDLLTSIVQSLKTTLRSRAILASYRARNRTIWSEQEQRRNKDAYNFSVRKNRKYNDDDDIEAELDQLLQAKQLSGRKERDIMQKVAFTRQLLDEFHRAMGTTTPSDFAQSSTSVPRPNIPPSDDSYPVQVRKFAGNLASEIFQDDLRETDPTVDNGDQGNQPRRPRTPAQIRKFIAGKHLSQDKLCAMDMIQEHFGHVFDGSDDRHDAPLLLVTGAPGVGKSWLVKAISELAEYMHLDKPIRMAFMGVAAINIEGFTVCKFLDIPTERNRIPSNRVIRWDADKLQQFKNDYDVDRISAIIIDEISMIKPWMLAYLDARLKEARQIHDKPFGGVAVIMLGDFDQQPPIGGSSLPQLAMHILRRKYERKRKLFFVKQTAKQRVELNSTLSRQGVELFKRAAHLQLTVQHRCADDEDHIALLRKMSSGSKLAPSDLDNYNVLSPDNFDIDDFLFSTIIVTGNYERNMLNAFVAQLWAQRFGTHVVRWRRRVKYNRWQNKPASQEQIDEAEKEVCFWEYFVPMAPAYLTHNLNVRRDLANGTMVRLHSLAMDTVDETHSLHELLQETPVGGIVDLPSPPTAINVELYPDFSGDTRSQRLHNRRKRRACSFGSVTNDRTIVIPIDNSHGNKIRWYDESIAAHSRPMRFRASTVPIANFFPIELGFCITVPKAQGRTIRRVVASLSEHPNPLLRFSWEQLYVVLSRIQHHNHLHLLLRMGNRNTLGYISELEKDALTSIYFAGYPDASSNAVTHASGLIPRLEPNPCLKALVIYEFRIVGKGGQVIDKVAFSLVLC